MTINNDLRYKLTQAIRYLECLAESLSLSNPNTHALSEIEYWISSLELIRNMLCNTENFDETTKDAILEIKSELANAFKYIYTYLNNTEKRHLANAWKFCNEAGDLIDE